MGGMLSRSGGYGQAGGYNPMSGYNVPSWLSAIFSGGNPQYNVPSNYDPYGPALEAVSGATQAQQQRYLKEVLDDECLGFQS